MTFGRPTAGVDFFFITGADALAGLRTWRAHEEVLDAAHLVGVSRPGHELADPRLGSSVTLVEVTALDISSTDCRRRVASGRGLDYLVPSAVGDYIDRYGLYRP